MAHPFVRWPVRSFPFPLSCLFEWGQLLGSALPSPLPLSKKRNQKEEKEEEEEEEEEEEDEEDEEGKEDDHGDDDENERPFVQIRSLEPVL